MVRITKSKQLIFTGDGSMIPSEIGTQVERLGQHHLLQFWDDLSPSQQAKYLEQLKQVDWKLIETFIGELKAPVLDADSSPGTISPPAHVVRLPKTQDELQFWHDSRRTGEDLLRAGKVGVVLLAGGQGTRLGFPHPKGMFPIGPVSGKTLFEIFADQITAISARVGKSIPYMIMTSDGTHEETVSFFAEHDHFGLGQQNVFFFRQGYSPCVDSATGKLLCAEKGTLSMSPDGHGGLLAAMLNAGLFAEMQKRGIELLFLHQVDNPLVKICDPAFLGLHVRHGAEVSTKVVAKTGPEEKVGLAVDLNGKTAMIEYSDLPEVLANERDSHGGLRFWAGNTAIHIFNRSFLEGVATSAANLPWHRARKRIPHIDHQGRPVQPATENGVKFERFLFDTLPVAKTALIVETSRAEEFAPLKNASGDFSPDYVRQSMTQVAVNWLLSAGVDVPANTTIEISPRFALDADELKQHLAGRNPLEIDGPLYLDSSFD